MLLHFPLLIDHSRMERGDQEVLKTVVLHHVTDIVSHEVPDQGFVKMFLCKMHVEGDLWDAAMAYQSFRKDLEVLASTEFQMPERPDIIGGGP